MHDRRWWRGVALFLLVLPLASAPAFAYIGPGVAAGAIASVFGVLGSILLGIFSVIYYPIKRLFKKRRKRAGGKAESPE
jgi:hypothetical protein